MKVVILGCGLIGKVVAEELAGSVDGEVIVVDRSSVSLKKLAGQARLKAVEKDCLADGVLENLIDQADLVIGALPGFLGYRALKRIIAKGKPVVDISFFPEDAFSLNGEAREKGVPILVDCGLAPGLSNLLLGRLSKEFDRLEDFVCHVGGLPIERTMPFEYKAPFSPIDVVEEYTRPARYLENGKILTKPALSEPEFLEVPGIGTLESFLTDGLRTLLAVENVGSMREKTIRYPGHREKILFLRDCGFFDDRPITIGSTGISPKALSSSLLGKNWRFENTDHDLTVMIVEAIGSRKEKKIKRTYRLIDRYDEVRGIHSMGRTTGYTCVVIAKLVLNGMKLPAGVAAPETLGSDPKIFNAILDGLAFYDIHFSITEETLD